MAEAWTRQKVEEILLLMQDVYSLNTLVNEEDGGETEFESFIEDASPSPEEELIHSETQSELFKYMREFLTPREIEILRMRYGFDTDIPMTLEEIGKHFGMTRERIRQIEERALRKLRTKFMVHNIKLEDI